ncbi:MAG: Inhibitor of kappaB kinase gamma-like protein [Verrucomicrobiales bacterium]|nr:Inhibitor of kappaB kinase gamma-like protein [Verrucomicrobiales bacterium]
MSSLKQFKATEKNAAHLQAVVQDLNTLVKDIDRCEKTINDLKTDLETLNVRHKDRKTTREDIAYLEDLLKCANKKLTWEKHIASLQKRTPALLEEVVKVVNDPNAAPDPEVRANVLQSLHAVQGAMERLQNVKS